MVDSHKIKNKIKRGQIVEAAKKAKGKNKLEKRLKNKKEETEEEAEERRSKNVPNTLDNTREFDATIPQAQPVTQNNDQSQEEQPDNGGTSDALGTDDPELASDIANDAFATYFTPQLVNPDDPNSPIKLPKILITTSVGAGKNSIEFCMDLTSVLPNSEYVKRRGGKGYEIATIAGWAKKRDYTDMMVINEDHKTPNAITLMHLPYGPTAYFKLSSVKLSKAITGHARPTPHHPELVLNNFATRLGHTVGRMFQALFPPVPEFEGRQVATFHVQRDFIFFRRHRYAFKSTEKTALQEIGPRFTLKLRWMKRGLPSIKYEVDNRPTEARLANAADNDNGNDGFEFQWKPELETSRRKFFL
ncbi:hypothetical protein E3Q23_04077 [Wallemia mellicola]|uniref:Brix-domain-containing protein n=1 Tax=Wallemia mellicola TaxID=1708541 RepID=A0AB74KAB3_9BASI|nr:hypothetical protein E3Q23_04077 [Wallemia mellicola]TIC50662.1 Brix-domain-containing protein [Wallemia mellicola]TIC58918.1 Brix-domain-containing protein [Wallemia mellicola]